MAAELQRTNPAELLYPENFEQMALIEQRHGLRRRPLWEFELDTARQQLNLQFGTRDLTGFGVEQAHQALRAAGCLLQYVKDTQRTSLPHIRGLTMERQQDGIIMDAATRRNLEITQNLSGGSENTLAAILDRTVTPMGSRMLKRWLHMPTRDVQVLNNRQQAIAALQPLSCDLQQPCVRLAIWSVFLPVWHCVRLAHGIWPACATPSNSCRISAPCWKTLMHHRCKAVVTGRSI